MATVPAASPVVSVVIPTHNRATLLCRAIASVLSQSFNELECIVVDDGSTDNTAQAVAAIQDSRLVYLRHETSRRASAARNTGIRHARGKYIAFLDDDDEWLQDKLKLQIDLLSKLPGTVGMVYCWLDYFSGDEKVNEHHPRLRGNVFPYVLDRQAIGNSSTLLVRREAVERVTGFDESLPRGNDGDFIRRVSREYEVDYVPEVLVKVYVDHGHERITREDRTGIVNGINSQKDKLKKFSKELEEYPVMRANILAHIGRGYGLLGEFRESANYFRKAIKTAPLSKDVYLAILRVLKRKLLGGKALEG